MFGGKPILRITSNRFSPPRNQEKGDELLPGRVAGQQIHPKFLRLSLKTWLVVSTHLKNISQNGNLPQIGVKINKYLKPPPRNYRMSPEKSMVWLEDVYSLLIFGPLFLGDMFFTSGV